MTFLDRSLPWASRARDLTVTAPLGIRTTSSGGLGRIAMLAWRLPTNQKAEVFAELNGSTDG